MNLFTSRTCWLSWLIVALLGCDRIRQDMAPADTNTDNTELFAFPGNKTAVDLTTLSSLQSATTFTITRKPQSGTLSFATNGLLLYEPNADFIAGDDDFAVSATQQSGAVTMPLTVKLAADADEVPCRAGALPDRADTPTGQPVTVEVLKNDIICDGTIDPASLRVVVKPKAGTVRVVGDAILYTPGSTTFTGRDEFVYKICSDGSRASCYVAPVLVVVGSPGKDCQIALNNDQVNYRQFFVTDSLIISVLANDQLCQSNRTLPISIVKTPAKGTVYAQTRLGVQTVIYKPNAGVDGTDAFIYQRCAGGTCQQSTVHLQVKPTDPACRLVAKNNQRTASLANDSDAKAGRLLLPVLQNDQICLPIATMRISENPANLNLKIRSGVVVYTLGSLPRKGTYTFTYELVDIKNNRTTAQVKVILTD